MLHATPGAGVSRWTGQTDLVGKPSVIEMRFRQKLGLQIPRPALTLRSSICGPTRGLKSTGASTHQLMKRLHHPGAGAMGVISNTVIGAIMVHRGEADAMIRADYWRVSTNLPRDGSRCLRLSRRRQHLAGR